MKYLLAFIYSQPVKIYGQTRDFCQLMERTAMCIQSQESVLLIGETGVGKTSAVQMLSSYTHIPLRVVNLSQDSEFADLIGG